MSVEATSEIPHELIDLLDRVGVLSYADFISQALYAENWGYYKKDKTRVGYESQSDFYTARSLSFTFSKLLESASSNIVGDLSEYSLVELGVERTAKLYKGEDTYPFKSYHALGVHDTDYAITGPCIVLANELLDAQPFHRLKFMNGKWCEMGVVYQNQQLQEIALAEISDAVQSSSIVLPKKTLEGYTLDISLAAETLFSNILNQPFTGLILFFDYGKDWAELIHNTPNGTGRSYYKHQCSGDLLASPGDQDITCHVCWDRLEAVASSHNFCDVTVNSQGNFFMHHAQGAIAQIVNSSNTFTSEKQSLKELIMPHHMGQKFQVLWAKR
jgi:SAM-dependent MidA family methyltransferase